MYETIIVERQDRVVTIRLNRPERLNALNGCMLEEILDAATPLDADPKVGCLVLTGDDRAFAAGADIAELQPMTFTEMFGADVFSGWDRFAALRIPKIAAVAGYALGGGCELAMMCDVILAADTARFGQPEIRIGVIPGIGGTQRLTRAIGRARAMDLVLTGRTITADEAERYGLVSRVVPAANLASTAQEVAETIAAGSKPVALMARECVAAAEETGLAAGLRFERRVYHAIYATADQKEGMAAFLEKRAPAFSNR